MNSQAVSGGGIDTSAFQGLLAEGGPSAPFADFDVEQELINIYQDPNTPDEQKRQILEQIGGIKQAGAEGRELAGLFDKITSPERRQQILQDNLAFEKERMAQAAPYKLAFALPGQIMDAFAKPALMQLAGSTNISNMMMQSANRNYGIAPAAMNAPPRSGVKYF